MAPAWFGPPSDGIIFCKHPDCHKMVRLTVAAAPEKCPGCSRKTKDGGDWWTIERPADKPIKGELSKDDRVFLRVNRIEPWEGGIETE